MILIQKMKKIYIVLVRDHEGKCYEEWYFFFIEKSKQTALDKYASGDKYFLNNNYTCYMHTSWNTKSSAITKTQINALKSQHRLGHTLALTCICCLIYGKLSKHSDLAP